MISMVSGRCQRALSLLRKSGLRLTLDGGEGDCIDAIDGWYDDSEGARWEAHEEPYHAVEFTDFEPLTGFASATGLTALKAAMA